MCLVGGSGSIPKATPRPIAKPPQQAPIRVDESVLEKRATGRNARRRKLAAGVNRGNVGSRGPLSTTSSSLLEYLG